MNLVVDTNRIIAALARDSASRKIILSEEFSLLTVGVSKEEIKEHKQELLDKAKLTEEHLDTILALLFSRILIVDNIVIERKMNEAKKIMGGIDPDDTPFAALALAVENEGIWSDDKHFEQQNRVRVWKTKELLALISKGSA